MYLNKVAFSEMIWRKTINVLPDLVQCKNKRGRCLSAKYQKCWKNEITWVFQKKSCVKNTLTACLKRGKHLQVFNILAKSQTYEFLETLFFGQSWFD